MRQDSKRLNRQRVQMDARLAQLHQVTPLVPPPRGGWIKAVREGLGMPAEQLGKRMGISKQAVLNLEANEMRKTITLESLRRAARALGCEVSYAIVPEISLEALVDQRAKRVARRKLARVGHSMTLEAQEPPAALSELQVDELADDLKRRLGRELWDEP